VKKVEDGDDGEISEPEDPLMLQRDAKDWKVFLGFTSADLTRHIDLVSLPVGLLT
jgi:hypothetical protein